MAQQADDGVSDRAHCSDEGLLIRAALEAAGVEFIPENGGGAGGRMRERKWDSRKRD